MTDLRKAAEMALEALEQGYSSRLWPIQSINAIQALRQALAESANSTTNLVEPKASFQPEQEPVAWHEPGSFGHVTIVKKWALENGWMPLYTAPPKRWVGLTDVERNNLAMGVIAQVQTVGANMNGMTNAILFIEQKLKEKNCG